MQAVIHDMGIADIGAALGIVLAIWLTLLIVRFGFLISSVSLIRLLDRRPSQRARRMSHRARVVSALAGSRGAVSLAIALSVPTTLDSGAAFPGRDKIVFVAAGLIVLTLLVQGPLLPVAVRWARLPADVAAEEETTLAERKITGAALAAVAELAAEHEVSDEVRARLTRDYEEHLELVDARKTATLDASSTRPAANSPLRRNEEYTRLRLAVIDRKRQVLVRMRHDGVIDHAVARQIQTRLDIVELRLTGVDAPD